MAPAVLGRRRAREEGVNMNSPSILLAVSAFLTMSGPLHAQVANTPLPPGEGRDLVAVACSQCHLLAPILAMRQAESGWRRFVTNMIMRGAQLNAREADTVIRYLATSFGPTAATSATTIALPGGAGKDLVETRCVACHDLERVTIIKRGTHYWAPLVADMVARGAPVSAEEAQIIVGYLVAQFGE
jgi:mono/diheme cytochrome c family protein